MIDKKTGRRKRRVRGARRTRSGVGSASGHFLLDKSFLYSIKIKVRFNFSRQEKNFRDWIKVQKDQKDKREKDKKEK